MREVIAVIIVVALVILGINFLIPMDELVETYIEEYDNNVELCAEHIKLKIPDFDPEVSGKGCDFVIVGADANFYFVPVIYKDEQHYFREGVEFSRKQTINMIIGSMLYLNPNIPDRKNYLFVNKAFETLSDYDLEDYFYRRYAVPLAVGAPNIETNTLAEEHLNKNKVNKHLLEVKKKWIRKVILSQEY